MLEHIPEELRRLPQWVCCGDDKIPLSPVTGKRADFTNPADWSSFDIAASRGMHVGFCLTKEDPYCIIDLDDKADKPASAEEKATHQSICKNLKSYVEQSISGRGLHIICKAKLVSNRNCQDRHIELYDHGRFFLLTGECWNKPRPIIEAQAEVDDIYANLPARANDEGLSEIDLEDGHLIECDDDEIIATIQKGSQAALFDKLWSGDMSGHNNDHSVADSALIAILTWHCKSNAQIVRMLQASGLGQRDKAYRPDYLQRTLAKCRSGREIHDIDLSSLQAPMARPTQQVRPSSSNLPEAPGAFGMLVSEILETMPRPVPEIAMVAALGLLAGIAGRQWHVNRPSPTGLNLYLILLGGTGVGKDQIPQVIDFAIGQIALHCPDANRFIGPGDFASSESIGKTLSTRPCFVSVIGEIGKKMTSWNDATQSNPVASQIKRTLLDAYSRSGPNHSLKARVYSNKDKDVGEVFSPALSLVGESAPESYFENLTESMIAEGFMPRWLVLQYEGIRLHAREEVRQEFTQETISRLVAITSSAISLESHNQFTPVEFDAATDVIAKKFDWDVDDKINEKQNDVSDQLWNRAALKAYRIAGLLAVLENPYTPVVTTDQFEFAKTLVTMEIKVMSEKFETGEIGAGDAKQICDVRRIVDEFYGRTPGELLETYKVPEKLSAKFIMPYGYLQRRTACMSAFRKDKNGSTAALHRAIQTLTSTGELVEVAPTVAAQLGYTGKAYKIPGK